MFDDLHDPNQPEASMKDLADVTERARAIRRRRAMWAGAGAAVLVVVAAIGIVAATRGNDSNKITPLLPDETTVPGVATTIVTVQTSLVPASSTAQTVPAVQSTTIPATVPDTIPVAPATDATLAPTSTVAPTTTEPPPSTALETTTTAVPVSIRPIVAITADGSAVIVALDGTQTLLRDGVDPDDPPPSEGENSLIDTVAVTGDSSIGFVGECCEPGVGYITRVVVSDTTQSEGTFGHGPTLSPDSTKLVVGRLQAVAVLDVNLVEVATTAEEFLGDGTENGFVWLDNSRFVVLSASPADAVRLQQMTLAADNTLQPGVMTETPAADNYSVRMAGSGPGVIYLNGMTPATLTAFDSTTLQRVPASDIALPSAALSAWIQDGELRWVDTSRHLHVGDVVVPGEYICVR